MQQYFKVLKESLTKCMGRSGDQFLLLNHCQSNVGHNERRATGGSGSVGLTELRMKKDEEECECYVRENDYKACKQLRTNIGQFCFTEILSKRSN